MSSGQPAPDRSPAALELDRFVDFLTQLGGVASAVEAIVATSNAILYRRAGGFRVGGEPLVAGSGARFDAASLTKPWMATLALALDASGELPYDARVENVFVRSSSERKAHTREVSIARLLRHQSGIAAWTPLWLRLGRRLADPAVLAGFLLHDAFDSAGLESAVKERLANAPATDSHPFTESLGRGRDEVATPQRSDRTPYSDLGYLLWGLAAERATGRSLAELLDSKVCAPLGVAPLGALAAAPPDPVECRLDNGKEVELAAGQGLRLAPQRSFHLGVPQDGNARTLGRLAGHAGLFVTADEMLALGREWLRPSRLLSPAARDAALAGDGAYALGWARWSADGSGGPALSRSSFGHTGFTGGSLWIDRERGRIHVLLAHRLASRVDFNPFRRELHRLAAALE